MSLYHVRKASYTEGRMDMKRTRAPRLNIFCERDQADNVLLLMYQQTRYPTFVKDHLHVVQSPLLFPDVGPVLNCPDS